MPANPLAAERSITACISKPPTPLFCTVGSTVIGPTPETGPRSDRKLLPTILPSSSATTLWRPARAKSPLSAPTPASTLGKSGGKLWAVAMAWNAS
jgi:hypothetical protein